MPDYSFHTRRHLTLIGRGQAHAHTLYGLVSHFKAAAKMSLLLPPDDRELFIAQEKRAPLFFGPQAIAYPQPEERTDDC